MSSLHSLLSNPNIDDKYDDIKLLIDTDRSVLQSTDNQGRLPIHVACDNPHVTLRIIQLLLDSWPESVSRTWTDQNNQIYDYLPIHCLCVNVDLHETVSIDILNTLIEASPESVRHGEFELPIHMAARAGMSFKFIKILVHEYPESVRSLDGEEELPIHRACASRNCCFNTVKYLFDIYPESIKVDTGEGCLLIHHAARSINNTPQQADIIKYILLKDPTYASKAENYAVGSHLPLHEGIGSLTAIQVLFDAYPEAILQADGYEHTPLELARLRHARIQAHEETGIWPTVETMADVITFLETQLAYAEKAQDVSAMTALDQNSMLPLHYALKDNAPLGSIKLLIKGNTSAVRIPDNNMAFPLHITCEFSSIKVVKYLMDMLDDRIWNHLDDNDDSILHYACRGSNCEVVKYLLNKQSPHVSERNADQKLPIQLFCESGLPSDSLENTDTIYRLLLAYPETVKEYM